MPQPFFLNLCGPSFVINLKFKKKSRPNLKRWPFSRTFQASKKFQNSSSNSRNSKTSDHDEVKNKIYQPLKEEKIWKTEELKENDITHHCHQKLGKCVWTFLSFMQNRWCKSTDILNWSTDVIELILFLKKKWTLRFWDLIGPPLDYYFWK